jgi:hypothetical protein
MSGTMSKPSAFAMVLCNSTSPPQPTSVNAAVMPLLMKALRMDNLTIATDHLTELPTELLQQVASHLSAHSIKALRTMNRAAATKTLLNFEATCLHSLTIQTTSVGVKQALEYLQIPEASKVTTHVTFTSPPTTDDLQRTMFNSNPSPAEIKALLAYLPNAQAITIRESDEYSLCSYNVCCVLVKSNNLLTELTLDGCALPGSTLSRLLTAHSKTLRYVALRNVQLLANSVPLQDIFRKIVTTCSLNRVVLASLSEGDTQKMPFISPRALSTQSVPAKYITRAWTSKSGEPQQFTMAAHLATMTGIDGVRAGLRGIVTGRFIVPVQPSF